MDAGIPPGLGAETHPGRIAFCYMLRFPCNFLLYLATGSTILKTMKTSVAYRRLRQARVAILLCGCLAVCGCAKADGGEPKAAEPEEEPSAQSAVLLLDTPGVRESVASGTLAHSENGVSIDGSNASLGYVMIKSEDRAQRLKARIGINDALYNYDLASDGAYHTFPLSQGDGTYAVRVLEQVTGDRFSPICQTTIPVALAADYAPFLFPNEYVRFDASSKAVAKAAELTANLDGVKEKADKLYAFVVSAVSYDYDKARSVQTGYLPDADETLKSGMGICFDYAALLGAMLRAQGIPAKLVIGSIQPENYLHAWNRVWIDGQWTLYDATLAGEARAESSYIEERVY